MAGDFDHLVGELKPGQEGWLPLDDAGYPTGPATLAPPPPPALACAVQVNAQVPLPAGEDLLLSESGAHLEAPLQAHPDPRNPDVWVPPPMPVITSLDPNTAECGSPDDITMSVVGTGFTPNSVIVFNGHDEPTTYEGPTTISTGVKPSLFVVPATCPVHVRDAAGNSAPMDFTFTEPAQGKSRQK